MALTSVISCEYLQLPHVPLVSIFLFVCSCALLSESRPISCSADKYADGCSIPLGLKAPFKGEFTPACNRHDICYGCGHHFNWTRSACDRAFYRDMKAICRQLHLRPKRLVDALLRIWNFFRHFGTSKHQCFVSAELYYDGVRLFADSHFERINHDYCLSSCAHKHGNPNEVVGED